MTSQKPVPDYHLYRGRATLISLVVTGVVLVVPALTVSVYYGTSCLLSEPALSHLQACTALLLAVALLGVTALNLRGLVISVAINERCIWLRTPFRRFTYDWHQLEAATETRRARQTGERDVCSTVLLRFPHHTFEIHLAMFPDDEQSALCAALANGCRRSGKQLQSAQRRLDVALESRCIANHGCVFRLAAPRLRRQIISGLACVATAITFICIAESIDVDRPMMRAVPMTIGGIGGVMFAYFLLHVVFTPTRVIIDTQGLAVRGVAIRIRIARETVRRLDFRGGIADGTREAVLTTPDRVITIRQRDSTATLFAEFERALKQLVPEAPRERPHTAGDCLLSQ